MVARGCGLGRQRPLRHRRRDDAPSGRIRRMGAPGCGGTASISVPACPNAWGAREPHVKSLYELLTSRKHDVDRLSGMDTVLKMKWSADAWKEVAPRGKQKSTGVQEGSRTQEMITREAQQEHINEEF